jgi:hypothetical protein
MIDNPVGLLDLKGEHFKTIASDCVYPLFVCIIILPFTHYFSSFLVGELDPPRRPVIIRHGAVSTV